ncbi:MAG: SMP-30/gluconolactonase/LRE family protein [Chloroflexi bacterium]|nr:SMP-30/gluconolactonase/LRE family protein [Chloroflexota bacterium]MYE41421.1 SMP-30/gluconolactonase/LRE family protein [Chloroflexota bacterium]
MADNSQWTPELSRRWDQGIARYPDPAVEVLDPRFRAYRIGNAAVERLYTGARWAEGPVWFGDMRSLVFSDIPNNRILRYCEVTGEVTLFRQPSNYSNGNTRDGQGRLVSCEHLTRRITRTEHDGRVTVLLDSFDGKPLNAPNDVVVHSDGSVWFTDPGYGILMNYEGERAEAELPTRVYRLDTATGVATVAVEDMVKPNGLCFSPDESRLYIADSGISHDPGAPGHIRVFEVVDGHRLRGGEVFADMSPGFADGMRTDRDGNLWSSRAWAGPGTDGVYCFTPRGELIGRILLPEPCANLCFGGVKKNRLFMTCSQSLYSLYVEAIGSQRP